MSRPKGMRLLQGNEACAWAAIDAGAEFFAGYPITPSSEVAEICAKELPVYGGVYMQMEDEIASMAAIIGASLSGKKTFTATSGPGFSLMQENLGVGIYQEVPCVIINVQRVGPSTGLATRPAQADVMQARWGTHGDHCIIALSPASVAEMYYLTVRAFNLAEKYRTPVILLSDEVIGHLRENVALPNPGTVEIINRKRPGGDPKAYLPYQAEEDGIPPMAAYGDAYIVHATSSCHDATGCSNSKPETNKQLLKRLRDKIYNYIDDIVQVEHFGPANADITLIAYGATSRVCKQAVTEAQSEGIGVNLLRLVTLWPFADAYVQQALEKAKAVIVPEMNQGQVLGEVQRLNCVNTPVYQVSRTDGELFTTEDILAQIREVAK
ncbi:2-oxoacid:acceptor oxidoreductase subunit alpha [Desulfoscipio sp. XC116]|uniref:2-oxoacid:acceptor oxidoreductase subunit alpha n=1 Tax=Desulfoscipio sp. XC116 TaxID=3144975 RepID=UPI00325AC883